MTDEKAVMNANQASFIKRWGDTITKSAGEQCKGGAYSYPGALDRYERALGLKPAEAWLMKRLLSFDWDGKGYVFCSIRKISEEADVSYGEVLKLMKSLELKGYIRDMGQHGTGAFSQVRDWSIKGLLVALSRVIECDPTTDAGARWAATRGHPVTMADYWMHSDGPQKGKPFTPYLEFTTPKQVNDFQNSGGRIVGWDPFYNGAIDIPKPQKRKQEAHTCECGIIFKTGSRNPYTRCPKCRKAHKRLSLKGIR